MKKRPIIIVAGGTGGHVMPASHVARYLINQGEDILWIGKKDSLETTISSRLAVQFIGMNLLPWRPKLRNIITLISSILIGLFILLKYRPKLVVSFGGYVAAPIGLATIFTPFPLIIHEQNITPGKANRLLNLFSKRTLVAYKEAFSRAHYVGNPVSDDIKARVRKVSTSLRILIVGGSQGSCSLNKIGCSIKEKFADRVDIFQQCGSNNLDSMQEHEKKGFRVVGFIEDMPQAYDWADIIICRSGALTLAEVRRAALPALLIPYPQASDNHQANNALYMAERSFAIRILEDNRCKARVLQTIDGILKGTIDITAISTKLFYARVSHSCQMIGRHCKEVING